MLLEEHSVYLAFLTVDPACGSLLWISEIRPFYPRPFQKHLQLIRPGVLNCSKKNSRWTKDAEQDAGARVHMERPRSQCRNSHREMERGRVTEKEDKERGGQCA